MKKSDIAQIVAELIELEPTLAEYKSTLEKNIAAIVSAKPNTKFTESFKKKLLADLQKNLHSVQTPLPTSPVETMQKFLYAIGGAIVGSLALYIAVIYPITPKNSGDTYVPPSSVAMERAMNNTVTQMPTANGQEDNAMGMIPNPRPQSGGGGGQVGFGGGGIMIDSKMIAPGEPYGYTAVEYVYDGTIDLPIEDTIIARVRTPLKSSQKSDLLSNTFVSEMMNVSSLKSLNVTNVTLSESGNEPLVMNVDFNDGSLSINRQINYANLPQSNCRDDACYQKFKIKKSDMLSEERMISIATAFMDDLGVDMSKYGQPSLQDDWVARYDIATDKSNFYFPEQASVVFPYLINGTPVYDEWGNANGVNISVDMRLKAATGVWGLRVMNLEEKKYDAVQDAELLREILRIGSIGGYMPEGATVQQAELGDPKMVYMMQYQWDQDTQLGYETYVPALAFPVRKMPENSNEYRKAVVIPLAKKLLEEKRDQMPPMPMPLPMPVEPTMDPATSGMVEPEMMPPETMEMMER